MRRNEDGEEGLMVPWPQPLLSLPSPPLPG